jgi:hypothetical protein
LIHCKNLCKCHSVPPTSTTIIKIFLEKRKGKGKSLQYFSPTFRRQRQKDHEFEASQDA